jgi:hypothetical protein
MLLGEFLINGRRMSIGVVHLKAGNYRQFGHCRKLQMHDCILYQQREELDDCILFGDFNIKDEEGETAEQLESTYLDTWTAVHPSSDK